jgi:hypothetical protein
MDFALVRPPQNHLYPYHWESHHHYRDQVGHQEGPTSVFRRLKGRAQKISQADGPANQG